MLADMPQITGRQPIIASDSQENLLHRRAGTILQQRLGLQSTAIEPALGSGSVKFRIDHAGLGG